VRGSLAVGLAVGACGAFVASASARALAVRISVPASFVAGAPCRVAVSVSRPIQATVLLQERDGRRWRTVAKRRLISRSVTLRCRAAARVGRTRRFRALVRRGDRTIARSQVVSMRVAPLPAVPAVTPPAPAPPAPPASAPAPRLDPAQFGVEGSGGPPSPETLALLGNPRVVFDDVGVADLRAGRIDPRIVAVLTKIAEAHVITVAAMCSDHPKLTAGGAVSPHYLGRGVDIARVDGEIVNTSNPAPNRPRARPVLTGCGPPPGPGRHSDPDSHARLLHRRHHAGQHPHRLHATHRSVLDATDGVEAIALIVVTCDAR
jgi:hypothetical protein